MKIETVPLILGALIALIGLALVMDAQLADRAPRIERRRRTRLERSRGGELLIGLGVIALGAAVAGRDTWRYSILAVVVGGALIFLGTWANRSYLGELVTNRGAARRRGADQQDRPAPGTSPRVAPHVDAPPSGASDGVGEPDLPRSP